MMKKNLSILWGSVFIIVGVIVGLNTLGITNINIFFDGWWTLFIIVPCFIDLFDGDDLSGSIIGIIIGVLLLLCCQDIINFDLIWKLMLPITLVLIGISILFKSTYKINKEIFHNAEDLPVYCATFGEQKVDLTNTDFNGANLTAVFGSVECDLAESKITSDLVVLATSIFGSIEIKVPENINVVVKSIPVFGAVSNKRKNPKEEKTKTIYIKGISIFGGIDIK